MLLVRTKVFMELIERIKDAENENEKLRNELQLVKQDVAKLKIKNAVSGNANNDDDDGEDLSGLVAEIMHGIPDKMTGKVRLTDGTE